MIRISFFGKMGDLMYALPAMRCVNRLSGEKIGLLVSGGCWQMVPILEEQPYIGKVELEDTKSHDLVPIERGSVSNFWRWYNTAEGDGQCFNLSLQPDFFKDEAPIS